MAMTSKRGWRQQKRRSLALDRGREGGRGLTRGWEGVAWLVSVEGYNRGSAARGNSDSRARRAKRVQGGERGKGGRGWKCKKAPGASLNTGAAAQALSFCFSYVAASPAFVFPRWPRRVRRCITSVTPGPSRGLATTPYLADWGRNATNTLRCVARLSFPYEGLLGDFDTGMPDQRDPSPLSCAKGALKIVPYLN